MVSFIRVGHKGADAIAPGNTLASFRAAVEVGVDLIEFDVLRPRSDFADGSEWRTAPAGPARGTGPLLVAHDWADARRREPLTLEEALDAFTEPPLDRLAIDLDLKIAGREDEVVTALRERGLLDRAMTSTMEVKSIHALAEIEPSLRRGWTLPKIGRDWTRSRLARPLVAAGIATMRARLPAVIRRHAPRLGVRAIWLYHAVASRALVDAAHAVDAKLICWTVDDAPRIEALLDVGADGICTNDPRLFAQVAEARPA
jgi:glycerophosphoryl diester phosphodiesterase